MEKKYVMALDQGTTSCRAILFNKDGEMVDVAQKKSSDRSIQSQAGLNTMPWRFGEPRVVLCEK